MSNVSAKPEKTKKTAKKTYAKSFSGAQEQIVDYARLMARKLRLNIFYVKDYDALRTEVYPAFSEKYHELIDKHSKNKYRHIIETYLNVEPKSEEYKFDYACKYLLEDFEIQIQTLSIENFKKEIVSRSKYGFEQESFDEFLTLYSSLMPVLKSLHRKYKEKIKSFCEKYGINFPLSSKELSFIENMTVEKCINEKEKISSRPSYHDYFLTKYFAVLKNSVIFEYKGDGILKEEYIDDDGYMTVKIKANPEINLDMILALIRNKINDCVADPRTHVHISKQNLALDVYELRSKNDRLPVNFEQLSKKLKRLPGTVKSQWYRSLEILYNEKITSKTTEKLLEALPDCKNCNKRHICEALCPSAEMKLNRVVSGQEGKLLRKNKNEENEEFSIEDMLDNLHYKANR